MGERLLEAGSSLTFPTYRGGYSRWVNRIHAVRYLSFSVIRQSSPRLNNVIVIGCLLFYCCVFLYGAEAFVESRGTHTVVCKVGEYCS